MVNSIRSAIREKAPSSALSAAKRTFYRGRRYECPLCRANLRTFRPRGLEHGVLNELDVVGGGWRAQAVCPSCGSVDRERLVLLYLRAKTDVFDVPTRLLHVAPEPNLGRLLSDHPTIDYLSADLASPDVMVKMDITDIDRPDASFDFVICNHVLEHVPHDRTAISEIRRVLRPGGSAILQVPISTKLSETYEDSGPTTAREREIAFGQEDHVRVYARDFAERVRNSGLELDEFDWSSAGEAFGARGNRYGLLEGEILYRGRRPH